MIFKRQLLLIGSLFSLPISCEVSLREQLDQAGYKEFCDTVHGSEVYQNLYDSFDIMVNFLQTNKTYNQKLYHAKERFIRSKNKNIYSTDFFGFYDESQQKGRDQISFYYATHFHQFMYAFYPEFQKIPEINNFLEKCFQIQQLYESVFYQAACQLDIEAIFSSTNGAVPILFKVVKYLPSYVASRPHYDGTAFSLFLDSTDNQSLLLSSYKTSFLVDDFFLPIRKCLRSEQQNSILLIPGALLTEFSIYPTPHIVMQSGQTRYATIAFAMRPNYILEKNELSELSNFKN